MTAPTAQRELRNLVAGELVDAVDDGTREIVNPADGNVIGRVPEGTRADVDRAVAAAEAARIGWRDTTPGQRMEALLALADAIDAHADELAALESANVGKPRSLAAEELPICSDELRFFAGAATRIVNGLRRRRVLISATGEGGNVLKIRPPLVFESADADVLLDELATVLAEVSKRSA